MISCQSKLADCFVALLNNKVILPCNSPLLPLPTPLSSSSKLIYIQVLLNHVISEGKKILTKYIKLLFSTKNVSLKIHLVEMMAAIALYSKAGNRYAREI